MRQAVFTLVTRGQNIFSEPNCGILDVSPENDCASPNVKTPHALRAVQINGCCVTGEVNECDIPAQVNRQVHGGASFVNGKCI